MRTKNSIKNILWAFLAYFINIFVSFISRKIFIVLLGIEYNGINGLFSSIISMLSITELGIGTVIIYQLYKPVSLNDKEKIKSLINFYKKMYRNISIAVLLIGLCILPFLNIIIGETTAKINIYYVYLLFLIDASAAYLFTYKRSILLVNQKERTIKKIHIGYILLCSSLQLVLLYLTKNYYYYLIVKIVLTIAENIYINKVSNKLYPFLKEKAKPLNKKEKKDIFITVKGLMFHKIGGFLVNGTDNILISFMFGIEVVGYYNNYYLIISSIILLTNQLFTALTASVGNLLVTSEKNKNYFIFNKLHFLNYCIASFSTSCLFISIQKFMSVWLGNEFLLANSIVITLVLYFYFRIMKFSIVVFKNAAGIYYEDRFIPIFESILNLIISILLGYYLGLVGIFIGTIVSNMLLYLYSYPKYVYCKIFDRSYWKYIKEISKFFISTIICVVISYFITQLISNKFNIYFELLIGVLISAIVFIIVTFIMFRKGDEISYIKNVILENFKIRKDRFNEK